jgi:hypothetical protein
LQYISRVLTPVKYPPSLQQPAHEEAEENALFIGAITAAAVEPLGFHLADLLGDADLHHIPHRDHDHHQHHQHMNQQPYQQQQQHQSSHRRADAALPLNGPTSAAISLAAAHESLAVVLAEPIGTVLFRFFLRGADALEYLQFVHEVEVRASASWLELHSSSTFALPV